MTIYIDLGTKTAILVAIQIYIEECFKKKKVCKDTFSNTVEGIFRDKKLQKFWLEKRFPQERVKEK